MKIKLKSIYTIEGDQTVIAHPVAALFAILSSGMGEGSAVGPQPDPDDTDDVLDSSDGTKVFGSPLGLYPGLCAAAAFQSQFQNITVDSLTAIATAQWAYSNPEPSYTDLTPMLIMAPQQEVALNLGVVNVPAPLRTVTDAQPINLRLDRLPRPGLADSTLLPDVNSVGPNVAGGFGVGYLADQQAGHGVCWSIINDRASTVAWPQIEPPNFNTAALRFLASGHNTSGVIKVSVTLEWVIGIQVPVDLQYPGGVVLFAPAYFGNPTLFTSWASRWAMVQSFPPAYSVDTIGFSIPKLIAVGTLSHADNDTFQIVNGGLATTTCRHTLSI